MKKTIVLGILAASLLTSGAFANDVKSTKSGKANAMQVTPEQREKMASIHEKMAACLRSDKPLNECRTEMRKSCQEMMGSQGCPMMGKMSGHMGHHMGGEMGGMMKNGGGQ